MTSTTRTFKEVVFERYSDFFDAETLSKWKSDLNEPITNESEVNMLELKKTFINFPTARPSIFVFSLFFSFFLANFYRLNKENTKIPSMVLSDKNIYALGESNPTSESVLGIVCKHLIELDLSFNLIADWNEVFFLIRYSFFVVHSYHSSFLIFDKDYTNA